MSAFHKLTPAIAALFLAVILLGVFEPPRRADAHPLGNFTVNRLVLIDLDGDGSLTLRYVVDMAEIATFQNLGRVDTNRDGALSATEKAAYLETAGPDLLEGLILEIDGRRLDLAAGALNVELLPGQAGLKTMRIVVDATAILPAFWQDGAVALVRDENHDGEPGWRQIVVRPGAAVGLFDTDVATVDVTSELMAYPEKLLNSPPASGEARFSFKSGLTTALAPASSGEGPTVSRESAGKALGRFASVVAREDLTPGFVLVALLLAAAWGAMHALGPGHGKTVVAAYLVGERGTWRHAVWLGLIVTATHTISVFALGAIAIFAANVLSADDVYYWLSVASGGLVALLGGFLLATRLRRIVRSRRVGIEPAHHAHGAHHHDHHHHDHHHDEASQHHGHSHVPEQPGWRGLVALGVSGGLVPCPTALVVMLGAVAIDRTVYGLVLVTVFSVGLASVLTGIGLLMVFGRRLFANSRLRPVIGSRLLGRFLVVSPVLSALAILGVGVFLTSQTML